MIINNKELENWLLSQQDQIDEIIKDAASSYYVCHQGDINFSYDLSIADLETLELGRSGDLCYDRPGTPVAYSLWYQGRRINNFITYISNYLLSYNENSLVLFDIGAGTGALQMATALAVLGLKELGIKHLDVQIINVDTSPFMIDYNMNYLWKRFVIKYPKAHAIKTSFEVNSWTNVDELNSSNILLAANYLFDHSDSIEVLTKEFLKLLKRLNPSSIFISTSAGKKKLLDGVKSTLKQNGYFSGDYNESKPIFSGRMFAATKAREWLKQNEGVTFSNLSPQWSDGNMASYTLNREELVLDLFETSHKSFDVFTPKFVVRRDIKLNTDQRKASELDGRPSSITGPAGCGKSVVISEKIKNILESLNYSLPVKILVTTFNKGLMNYLLNWLIDILDSKLCCINPNDRRQIIYIETREPVITLFHFDILPTQIAKIKGDLIFDESQKQLMQKVIDTEYPKLKLTDDYKDLFDLDFLMDEFHRIIYGKNILTVQEYIEVDRKGRRRQLGRNQRSVLWHIFKFTEKEIIKLNKTTLLHRRREMFNKQKNGFFNGIYDHVLVDEFQDCTETDYRIFYYLLKDNNNLTLAGDFAQAVHIGGSANLPRVDNENQRLRNYKNHSLEGSYRLPARISEAILPLSLKIKEIDHSEADVITPYKGSPPGARPIVVYASDSNQMAKKVIDIVDAYSAYDLIDLLGEKKKQVTILEKDYELRRELNLLRNNLSDTDTILRLKGLEKTCVLWSTRIEITDVDEINNFIYTIITRTSGLLLIAVFPETPKSYIDIIKEMNQKRVIYWDQETQTKIKNGI